MQPTITNNSWFSILGNFLSSTGSASADESPVESNFPNEAIAHIFTCLTDPKSYVNFAAASRKYLAISQRLGQISVFPYSIRKHIFTRGIAFNTTFEKIPVSVRGAAKCFYDAFCKRCLDLGIPFQSGDFNDYVRATINRLSKIAEKGFQNKVEKLAIDFSNSIYLEMIHSYAVLPAEEITIESFKSKVAQIKDLFPKRNGIDIEHALRKATRKNHFETLASKDHKYFALAGAYATHSKEQYRKELEDKVLSLPNAHTKMMEVKIRLYETKDAFLDRLSKIFSFRRRNEFTVEALYTLLLNAPAMEDPDPQLLRMQEDFQSLYQQYQIAKNEFEEISLIPGKLDHFNEDFLSALGKTREFYRELCQEVTPENKQERQNALHAILYN